MLLLIGLEFSFNELGGESFKSLTKLLKSIDSRPNVLSESSGSTNGSRGLEKEIINLESNYISYFFLNKYSFSGRVGFTPFFKVLYAKRA